MAIEMVLQSFVPWALALPRRWQWATIRQTDEHVDPLLRISANGFRNDVARIQLLFDRCSDRGAACRSLIICRSAPLGRVSTFLKFGLEMCTICDKHRHGICPTLHLNHSSPPPILRRQNSRYHIRIIVDRLPIFASRNYTWFV